jgi:hypothetical protein
MDYIATSYTMGRSFDFNSIFSDYGPGFNSKCLIGYYSFNFKMQNAFKYDFIKTTQNNYTIY